MSLMEMLVGLSILGLVLSLALTQIGPWFAAANTAQREGQYWRDVVAAQLTLSELTAGALYEGRAISTSEARFQALAPRLSASPIAVRLWRRDGALMLSVSSAAAASTLFTSQHAMRFREDDGALLVETLAQNTWRPLIVAPLPADTPMSCAFDFVSRNCR